MTVLESANAVVRFGLELCALGALGYWGFEAGDGLALNLMLGLGAPLAFALVWGAYVAPKAPYRLADPQRLMLEIAVFGLAAIALLAANVGGLAVVLALAVAVNIGLMFVLGQRRLGGI